MEVIQMIEDLHLVLTPLVASARYALNLYMRGSCERRIRDEKVMTISNMSITRACTSGRKFVGNFSLLCL